MNYLDFLFNYQILIILHVGIKVWMNNSGSILGPFSLCFVFVFNLLIYSRTIFSYSLDEVIYYSYGINRLYFNILCTFVNIILVLCLNIQLNCKCTCINLLWCIKDRGCSCVGWHNNPWIWKISTWRLGLRAGEGLHKAAMHRILCGKLEATKMRVLSPKEGQG